MLLNYPDADQKVVFEPVPTLIDAGRMTWFYLITRLHQADLCRRHQRESHVSVAEKFAGGQIRICIGCNGPHRLTGTSASRMVPVRRNAFTAPLTFY